MSEMKNNTCREVWSWNRNEEMSLIQECLRTHKLIAMDTEFPGSLRETSHNATDEERYNDMRFSVGKTKVIQLGLSLFDVNGSIGGTWEINFADFRETEDARNEKSIAFLKHNGLDLKKIREEGIGIHDFFLDLNRILKQKRNITWVTFHGSYDIAYLFKGLTGQSLPVTSERFSKSVARVLGSVYDLKVMAGRYKVLSSRIGLERLACELGVNRVGIAHHAGSDSELTALVFAKMAKVCDNVGDSEGYVYGLGYRIISERLKQEAMMIHPSVHQMHMNHVMMMRRCYGPPPPLPPPLPLPMSSFYPGLPPFGGFVLMPIEYQCSSKTLCYLTSM